MQSFIVANISEPVKAKEEVIKFLNRKISISDEMISRLEDTVFKNEECINSLKLQIKFDIENFMQFQKSDEEKEGKINHLTQLAKDLKSELNFSQEKIKTLKEKLENVLANLKRASKVQQKTEHKITKAIMKNKHLSELTDIEKLGPRPLFSEIQKIMFRILESPSPIISLQLFKVKSNFLKPKKKKIEN